MVSVRANLAMQNPVGMDREAAGKQSAVQLRALDLTPRSVKVITANTHCRTCIFVAAKLRRIDNLPTAWKLLTRMLVRAHHYCCLPQVHIGRQLLSPCSLTDVHSIDHRSE